VARLVSLVHLVTLALMALSLLLVLSGLVLVALALLLVLSGLVLVALSLLALLVVTVLGTALVTLLGEFVVTEHLTDLLALAAMLLLAALVPPDVPGRPAVVPVGAARSADGPVAGARSGVADSAVAGVPAGADPGLAGAPDSASRSDRTGPVPAGG